MKKKLAPLWLILLVLVAYAPALRNGLVWDDEALILRDPLIRSLNLIGEGFAHFLFTDATASDFYRPIQRLTYTLDYAAFFFSPLGYHLVSIFWHAAAAVALFYFAEEFLARCQLEPARRFWVAFLASVVWALHPIQSAAVVYVAGRADPLAAAFGFSALYFVFRMWRATGNRRWALGLAAGGCFLASALSKEMGLIFLLILLILTGLERRRAVWLGAAGLMVGVLFAYLSLRLTVEHTPPPAAAPAPLLVRPIIAARAVAEYAGVIVLPRHLRMERDVATHPQGSTAARMDIAAWRELQTLLGLVLIAACLYGIWRSRRRPAVAVPLILAAVCYLPISGLIALNATVAEHWFYLPSAFLFLGGAAACETSGWPQTKKRGLRVAAVCLTIWFLFLPLRTFWRTFDWKDQRTFLTRTFRDGGDSAQMWINLGGLELNEGHLEAARAALDRALAKEPNNPLALLNLAAVTMRQGDFPQTQSILKKVVEPPEMRARAEESLVVLENRETGRVNLLRLRLAARLGPPNWSIEKRYVQALTDLHFFDRAITELKTCLNVAPYRAESWQMMSDLLRQTGRPNEAAIALAEAEACDVHLHEHGAAQKF
ncbi:MAG: tetratricopeptide repeat protein [Verrucomicrobiota bacterium]|nr:tetratricopeptide repeat protein [Verrucomicrobiota bacterium]